VLHTARFVLLFGILCVLVFVDYFLLFYVVSTSAIDCLERPSLKWPIKANFHYAAWFEAGRRPAESWNLAYRLPCYHL